MQSRGGCLQSRTGRRRIAHHHCGRQLADTDQVKERILKLYNRKPRLEGIVLVGDIPVARVLGAQHMTTAFKMHQTRFPKNQCSVPSDRFYDCFDLQFNYIEQDSLQPSWHYYWLSEKGSQRLQPAIYSARMKVPDDLCHNDDTLRYELLRGYLQKVVAAHKENNPFDRLIHFAGHGYNSDCLTTWRQFAQVFREHFPQAFTTSAGNSFLNFRQDPVMKYKLYDQIQKPGTDLLIFYEHGAPGTQYINGDYPAQGFKEHLAWGKHTLRMQYKRYKKPEDQQKFIKTNCDMYGLDPAMFHPDTLAAYAVRDSIDAVDRNILLEDLNKLKPGPGGPIQRLLQRVVSRRRLCCGLLFIYTRKPNDYSSGQYGERAAGQNSRPIPRLYGHGRPSGILAEGSGNPGITYAGRPHIPLCSL